MLSQEYETWAKEATSWFKEALGLDPNFSLSVARLYIALWSMGLNPQVKSGFRDPRYQASLQARWDQGDRSGLRARPASTSLHTITTFLGLPAAKAVDIVSLDESLAARVATQLGGIGAGIYFSKSDPGHYYAT